MAVLLPSLSNCVPIWFPLVLRILAAMLGTAVRPRRRPTCAQTKGLSRLKVALKVNVDTQLRVHRGRGLSPKEHKLGSGWGGLE